MLKNLKPTNTSDALIEYDNVMEASFNFRDKYVQAKNVPVKELIEAALQRDLDRGVKFAPKSTAMEIQKSIIAEFKQPKHGCTSDPKNYTKEGEDLLMVPMIVKDIPIIVTYQSKTKNTSSFVDFMFWLDRKSIINKQQKGSYHHKEYCMNVWLDNKARDEKRGEGTGYAPVSESNTTIKDILSL